MATKRGTSWQGVVYGKGLAGGRARRNFETKKEAEAWELDSKARLLRGEPIDMGENVARHDGVPVTLHDLVEHTARVRWATQGRSGTIQTTRGREIVKLIGPSLHITKLNKHHIDVARAKLLESGKSTATVNRFVAALSTCLTNAVDMDIIARKPKCDKYDENEHRIRRFTPAEEAKALDFFERAGLQGMYDYLIVSLDTGLRQGEVLNLRQRDVEGDKLTVWGTGAKSGKTRPVPLTARVKVILEKRRTDDPAAFVFDGLNEGVIRRMWDKLASRMGLKDDPQFVPHILRHEFCSRLADRDLNAAVIQALAGHSTLAVTQRYIHVRGDSLIRAIKQLEAV